jgi:hypothetical protein
MTASRGQSGRGLSRLRRLEESSLSADLPRPAISSRNGLPGKRLFRWSSDPVTALPPRPGVLELKRNFMVFRSAAVDPELSCTSIPRSSRKSDRSVGYRCTLGPNAERKMGIRGRIKLSEKGGLDEMTGLHVVIPRTDRISCRLFSDSLLACCSH